jgi:replicative DNA helicase
MPSKEQMLRQLARLSGVPAGMIRDGQQRPEDADPLERARDTLISIQDHLTFCPAPFTLSHVTGVANKLDAGLIVFDYIQRFSTGESHSDKRTELNAIMDRLRAMAAEGKAVIVVSSLGRVRDFAGRSSYDEKAINLASYKESGELEYGADEAFALVADRDPSRVTLKHLKSRYGEHQDVSLIFNREVLRFDAADESGGDGENQA